MTPEKENSNDSALKILIADDVTTNRMLAARVLERKGHQVVVVEDGLQAYEAFLKEVFDVILMDIQMPVMDGLETSRKIRDWEKKPSKGQPPERKKRIPIIALTANDEEDDRQRYHEAGLDGVLTKPLDIKNIIPTIRAIISETNTKP